MKHGAYMVWPVSGQDIDTPFETIAGSDRFSIDGSCVYDRLTGLTWSRSADPADGLLDWQQAIDTVAQMNASLAGGHTDWRVPTIRELEGQISLATHSPALPGGHPFIPDAPVPTVKTDLKDGNWHSGWSTQLACPWRKQADNWD